jgi:glycosyltransferase involved in cell wall biosynthesis
MNDEVFLTVVTATRDVVAAGRKASMERCVKSVSAIPVPHEHIVCDGGSTDSTMELLESLSSSHRNLRVFSEPDNGIYQAFNRGVMNARGKWIYFLGSDDYLTSPCALVEVLNAAESKSAQMAISPVEHSDGSCYFSGIKDFGNILIIKPYSHQGVLMHKSVIEDLGFFSEEYRIASDFKLCLMAHLKNVSCIFVNKRYANFSVGTGISCVDATERSERLSISAELLSVEGEDRRLLTTRQILPFCRIIPLLWHPSSIIRRGARYAFYRRVAYLFRLLDETGGPGMFISFLRGKSRKNV